MSGGSGVLSLKQEDVRYLLTARTHIGASNLNFQMEQYVYKRRNDGVHLIDLRKTWEKILLAARAIVAVENSSEICAISCSSSSGDARPLGQRAVLKFSKYTGATPIAGRYTPGTFTNQIQKVFKEPRLLVVCDPSADHQPVEEASYSNIPVIAFCNTDSSLRYVDIAIPCNNKAQHSIGLMWWLLTREVLRMRGTITREVPWDVMVDMFIYRDPEEGKKEDQAALPESAAPAATVVSQAAPNPQDFSMDGWSVPQETPIVTDPEPFQSPQAAAPLGGQESWDMTVPKVTDWSTT